jgi:hypothetical protein
VTPVGVAKAVRSRLRITRTRPDSRGEKRLGAVRFVPLIGAQGWARDRLKMTGIYENGLGTMRRTTSR